MRLSEAIALGRTVVTPTAGMLLDPNGKGCALGMAGIACGALRIGDDGELRFGEIEKAFPWYATTTCRQYPCECQLMEGFKVSGIVAHIFDHHVLGANDWTLDQLIDWVRSVEPAEETPSSTEAVCHRTTESSGSCATSRDAELPELAKEAGE